MHTYKQYWLPALILVAVLMVVAACASSGTKSEQGSTEQTSQEATNMPGMDPSNMDMSTGSMSASEMLMENGTYSDERFIDAMVPHHQGAIDMAQVALENAEHPEIRTLAENIISAQEAEIA